MFILPEICTENVLAHLDIVSGVPFLVIPMGYNRLGKVRLGKVWLG
jgi:hypothetical protein